MSEEFWETFDDVFRTINKEHRRVEELEARIAELEKRLNETNFQSKTKTQTLLVLNEMPSEKAA